MVYLRRHALDQRTVIDCLSTVPNCLVAAGLSTVFGARRTVMHVVEQYVHSSVPALFTTELSASDTAPHSVGSGAKDIRCLRYRHPTDGRRRSVTVFRRSATVVDGLRAVGRVIEGFAWMCHGGSLNPRKPRVQASFAEPQHVVCLIGMPMPSLEAKPSVETLDRLSKTPTQLRV